MTRPENDNELLREAEETAMCAGIVATAVGVALIGVAVGFVWWLTVYVRVRYFGG